MISVAKIDLGDRRDTPQTECPLVHPLDRDAPRPTKKPAAISSKGELKISNGFKSKKS